MRRESQWASIGQSILIFFFFEKKEIIYILDINGCSVNKQLFLLILHITGVIT